MESHYDILIVGGGAAGLFAAAYMGYCTRQKHRSLQIAVCEKAPRVGKKLAVTGNGTCNLSHIPAEPHSYHGSRNGFVNDILAAYPPERTRELFQKFGVETRRRADGRVYPTCLQASAVLDCLRLEMAANGTAELVNTAVTQLTPKNGEWIVTADVGTVTARRVIVAAGGAASPSVGGCIDGYALLRTLGCKIIPPFPSVVPIRTETAFVRALKGIRVDAGISLICNGQALASARGELLFTDYGLSGPAVMQISRHVGKWEQHKNGEMTVRLDLVPSMSLKEVHDLLLQRQQSLVDRKTDDWMTGFIHKRIGQTLLRSAKIPLDLPLSSVGNAQLALLASRCKAWPIAVNGTMGFGAAQVTAGGADTASFDPHTLEHLRHPGLFAVGEVLDVDGDCGGYNLQWAWSSAMAASEKILSDGELI